MLGICREFFWREDLGLDFGDVLCIFFVGDSVSPPSHFQGATSCAKWGD
jgi:hypothetical protein